MANEKNSFLLYYEYAEQFKLLSDRELGQLIRAVYQYELSQSEPALPPKLQLAFSFIKSNLIRDRAKYDKKCETNRENGQKGGRPASDDCEEQPKPEASENPKKPFGYSGLNEKPKKPDNDKDKENDSLVGISKSNTPDNAGARAKADAGLPQNPTREDLTELIGPFLTHSRRFWHEQGDIDNIAKWQLFESTLLSASTQQQIAAAAKLEDDDIRRLFYSFKANQKVIDPQAYIWGAVFKLVAQLDEYVGGNPRITLREKRALLRGQTAEQLRETAKELNKALAC